MITNPIFKREFVSSARSPRNLVLVGLYLALLAFTLLIMWPSGGILSAVSDTGKQIFLLFFNTNLTLLILLVPAFTATAITYEKENSTYPALFTTLLTPLDIMFGKLAASVLMLLILVCLSLPIASICALTGGVNLAFILKTMALLLMTALSYGLIGLMCSSIVSKSYTAIMLNYVCIMVLAGGTWLPDALLGNLVGFRFVWQLIRSISPYDAMFFLLYPETYRMTMNIQLSAAALNPFQIYMIAASLISLLAFGVFFKLVLRPAGRSSKAEAGFYSDDAKTQRRRRLHWPFYLIDPLKRKHPIRSWSNPVFVTEMRSKLFANPKFVIRGVSLIFVISLTLLTLIALQFGTSLNPDTVRMVAIVFQIGVVAMLAPGVSSGLITDEITNGTLLGLRMTPLKPSTVVLGKLKATFFYALIFIISSAFVLLSMAYLENQQVFPDGSPLGAKWWKSLVDSAQKASWWGELWNAYRRLALWVMILLLSTITFLTGGLFASSISKKTGMATAISYTITALICLVSFAPLVLSGRLPAGLSAFILSFNPVAAAMQITSDAFSDFPGLWQNNILALCGLTAFFLVASTIRAWFLFNARD